MANNSLIQCSIYKGDKRLGDARLWHEPKRQFATYQGKPYRIWGAPGHEYIDTEKP